MEREGGPGVGPYLLPGERILWTGRPDPWRLLGAQDIFLVPFSLVWGGGTAYFLVGLRLDQVFSVAELGSILFALFGQYLIWGRFVTRSIGRRFTVYAVTDQRVLISRWRSVQAVSLRTAAAAMSYTMRRDGSGSISFEGSSRGGRSMETDLDWLSGRAPAVFRDIPQVATVARLIAEHASVSGWP